MDIPVWVYSCCDIPVSYKNDICGSFNQHGINLVQQPPDQSSFGIILFQRVDYTFLEQVRHLSSKATLLAVCIRTAEIPASEMWPVLEAGAIDLLWWSPGSNVCDQILCRFKRWQGIQDIVDSSNVRKLLIGNSPVWRDLVRSVVEGAVFNSAPVLITGETGTGKDLIAQSIHLLNKRQGQFIVLDCTTLSPELAGSELFGHERGAFTGATNARDGAFALADGGTLFLDEVGELPLPLQAQLLRAIQERKYKRVGGNSWQPTQFRLVCATNRDLEGEVARGRFRADLYYRIAAWRCRTPALRDREGDILVLASHFFSQLSDNDGPCILDPAVREYLLSRPYPGNVRDLRQTITRIWCRHSAPGPITIGDVPPDERINFGLRHDTWPDGAFEASIQHALKMGLGLSRISQIASDVAIRLALKEEGDNNHRAAARLGVTDRALQLRRKAQSEGARLQH
jgi:transcriptional regulator with GAF, ATPase, and Fis domain